MATKKVIPPPPEISKEAKFNALVTLMAAGLEKEAALVKIQQAEESLG